MLAMFLDVCDKSMEQQNTLIEERIISWRGGNPQVDDMTLVGIRV
jgi:serine phosphatase RsbU (regulator of sigma subunit)